MLTEHSNQLASIDGHLIDLDQRMNNLDSHIRFARDAIRDVGRR